MAQTPAPADNTYDPTTVSSASSSRSFLSVILVRWPVVLICLVVGGIVGFLAYSRQPPVYESRAQVQVIKTRTDETSASDVRMAFVEDYIATQVTRYKSEGLWEACAKRLNPNAFSPPLPTDEYTRAKMIGAMLTVARDRDSTTVSPSGSSIISLTVRGGNPTETRLILETLIATNDEQLKSGYKTETDRLIERLEQDKRNREQSIADKDREIATADGQRVAITPENITAVTMRLSATRDRLNAIELELLDIGDQLNLIEKAGPDRRKRVAVFLLLGGEKKTTVSRTVDTSSPEASLLTLQAQREELTDRLGKDHQSIKQIDAQIEYYKRLQAKMNPDNPTGELDELELLKDRLLQRRNTAEKQKRKLEEDIKSDTKVVQEASPLTTKIDTLNSLRASDSKSLAGIMDELTRLKVTQQNRGYETRVMTSPRDGARVGPALMQWLMGGLALGGALGAGLAFLAEMSDKSFRSPAEIRERLGVPIYGHIPHLRRNLPSEVDPVPDFDTSLVTAHRPKSIEAEAYRGVRTQFLVSVENRTHQVIQVTSPNPGDGKSTLIANLAIALAQAGKRVILLDCDFRKPRVHKIFHLPNPEVGLASVTNGDTELNAAIRHGILENLDLLPCGPRPENPAELLTGMKFQEVLAKLKLHYDYVLIDTPPLLAVSDPRVVAQRVDGILLVFKVTKRARPQVERAREQLSDMGANLLGVVVNSVGGKSSEYGYGYGYNYGYKYNYDYGYAYEYAEQYADQDEDDEIENLTPARKS